LAARGLSFDGLGNRAMLSLLRSGRLQRKARVSQPGDPLEHEADRAASAVVSGAHSHRTSLGQSSSAEIQRMPTEEQKLAMELGLGPIGGSVDRAEPTPPPNEADAHAPELVAQLYGGRSLDERTRGLMESRFAEDFSDVRIHTGYRAGEAADSVQARAFTVREDIVFAEGQYAPETTEGQRLLAHELAHVVQQRRPTGGVASERQAERDARDAARELTSGGTPTVRERATPGAVQRDGEKVAWSEIPAYPARNFPLEGGVTIRALEPGGNYENVLDIKGQGGSTPRILSLSAWEHGDEVKTLTVAVAVAGPASADPLPTKRWPHVEPILSNVQLQEPETGPPQPDLPQPAKTRPRKLPPSKTVPPSKTLPQPKPTPVTPPGQQTVQVEPQAEELEQVPSPIFKESPPSPANRVDQILQTDPAAAALLAPSMSDADFQALTPANRAALLWALALNPAYDELDVPTVNRLFENTPDRDLAALQDEINANNGQLLFTLSQGARGEGATELADGFMHLWTRSLSAAPIDQLNWLRAPLLSQAPQFGPPGVAPPYWVGRVPLWAKDLRLWTDARGQMNIWTPELGLTTWDREGKRLGVRPPDEDRVLRTLRAMDELQHTGGKRFIEGKGWLNEAGWQQHIENEMKTLGAEANRQVEFLESGVQEWAKTQGGAAYFASVPSHLLGGRWFDDPDKIVQTARQDVQIALREMKEARTEAELEEAKEHLHSATTLAGSFFSRYKEDVFAGGGRTEVGIKLAAAAVTIYVSAPVLFAGGAGAVTLQTIGWGAVGGGAFSALRQGAELLEGTRQEFSWSEVGQGAVMGGGFALVPEFAPVFVGAGVYSSVGEFAQGHPLTGAVDVLGTFAALKGAGGKAPGVGVTPGRPTGAMGARFRPRAAAIFLRVGTAVSDVPGLSGRSYTPSIPIESTRVLVVDATGRPIGVTTQTSSVVQAPAVPSTGPTAPAQAPASWQTVAIGDTPILPYQRPVVVNFADPADVAFAPGAQYSVGEPKGIARSRVTGSGRQIISLDTIPLTRGQRQAAQRIHGQTMPAELQQAWRNTANAREQADLAEIHRLLNLGRRAEAVSLAREVTFANHRNRFWRAVRRDPALQRWFTDAGMVFPPGEGPPIFRNPASGARLDFMSLEHSQRLADDPLRSVDPTNLQFVLGDENSYFLEWFRANDPFQNP
jgi:hypothetical protein